jgi:hydroxymethylbilane synthase
MTNIPPDVRLGTRTSQLALIRTQRVIALLRAAWPGLHCTVTPFVTEGDRTLDRPLPELGGKGVFTAELEAALLAGRIDLAVHSLKDLPVENSPGLTLGALCDRIDVRDGLVAANGWTVATLPAGSVVGTCSTRRQAQLLALRPDLLVKPIRDNVPNRIEKVRRGDYDATLLAAAGLLRLHGRCSLRMVGVGSDAAWAGPGGAGRAVSGRRCGHAGIAGRAGRSTGACSGDGGAHLLARAGGRLRGAGGGLRQCRRMPPPSGHSSSIHQIELVEMSF